MSTVPTPDKESVLKGFMAYLDVLEDAGELTQIVFLCSIMFIVLVVCITFVMYLRISKSKKGDDGGQTTTLQLIQHITEEQTRIFQALQSMFEQSAERASADYNRMANAMDNLEQTMHRLSEDIKTRPCISPSFQGR